MSTGTVNFSEECTKKSFGYISGISFFKPEIFIMLCLFYSLFFCFKRLR